MVGIATAKRTLCNIFDWAEEFGHRLSQPCRWFVLSCGVFFTVLLVYLPAARYELVGLDDHDYVYGNDRVISGLTADNAKWAVMSCGYAYNWHPLTWLSLQADATLLTQRPKSQHGGSPDDSFRALGSFMHAHNVALHAANATLLFVLILVMLGRLEPQCRAFAPVAALLALLWAIHPLRTEVVCWVSERKELLCVFWMLLTLILWSGRRTAVRYALALPCFALALLAKPLAVTLPAVLFAWDFVMTRRRFGDSILSAVPFLLLAAAAGSLTLAAQGEPLAIGMQFSILEKIVMSFSAPVIYLRQTFWPVGLSAFYPPKPPVPWIELTVGVFLFAGSLAVCIIWLRRRQSKALTLLSFAVAWCLVSLVPMLGIVKVGDQTHSDRYTYWVGCGLIVILSFAAAVFAGRFMKETVRALAVILAVLTVATWFRMPVWKNSLALYSDAVPKSWAEQPTCALSRILRQQGKEGELQADAILREAIMRTPYSGIRAEFAHLLASRAERSSFFLGDDDPAFGEARYEALAVLSSEPTHPLANEALALVEMKEGKWESALKRLELARAKSEAPARIDHYAAVCRERLSHDRKDPDVQK